jgi:hypothetical protein
MHFWSPYLEKRELLIPYFKNQYFDPPISIFLSFVPLPHFDVNFADLAVSLMIWQWLCGQV